MRMSKYWQNILKKENAEISDLREGRTFDWYNGKLGCNECCNGDRCDDPTHRSRESCPYCLGTAQNKSCFPEPDKKENEKD